MADSSSQYDLDTLPGISLKTALLVLFAVTSGMLTAVIVLPAWLPGITRSIFGPDPKVYWFLSRSTAIVAFCLLWFSMVFGLLMTNKMARLWPGAPTAYELHQFVSLVGISFVLVHALILMGDRYIQMTLPQVMVPFASVNYKPIFVGLGQLGFYLWLIIIISFYIRKRIGRRAWRLIHFASFISFIFAMVHGITSGSDTGSTWMQSIYWFSAASIVFLTIYRILNAVVNVFSKQSKRVI
jgi:predicted ferric reductase